MAGNSTASSVRTAAKPAGLASLQETSAQRTAALRQRVEASKAQTDKLNEIAASLHQAVARGDIDQVRILNSTFETARADLAANTKDLAGALMGLSQQFKDVGIEIKGAQEMSVDEQKLIDEANALVKRMEGRQAQANLELAAAEKKWSWFGIRDRAVAAANANITKAGTDLEGAKANVGSATQMAQQLRRTRLENARLDESMQNIQSMAQQILDITQTRIAEIQTNLDAIELSRTDLTAQLTTLATEVEKGDADIRQAKTELENLRTEQGEKTENTPEWAQLNEQIQAKVNELAETEAKRNKAFSLEAEGRRFLEMYKLQEEGQRGAKQFQETWIALMQAGVEHRSTLYASMLGILQAVGDQEAMSLHDALAVEEDERIQTDAAKNLVAIRTNMLKRLEGLPEQTRRMQKISDIEQQSKADFDSRLAKLLDEFRKMPGG